MTHRLQRRPGSRDGPGTAAPTESLRQWRAANVVAATWVRPRARPLLLGVAEEVVEHESPLE